MIRLAIDRFNKAAIARSKLGMAARKIAFSAKTGRYHWPALFLRLGRLVQALDLGVGAQLGHVIDLCLAGRELLDFPAHLLERRRRAHALVLDLEHMPAELSLDRVGDLALLQPECDFGKFRHHLVAREKAEIAAAL